MPQTRGVFISLADCTNAVVSLRFCGVLLYVMVSALYLVFCLDIQLLYCIQSKLKVKKGFTVKPKLEHIIYSELS